MPSRVLYFLVIFSLIFAASCSTGDSRLVNKPFEELTWVERTRSPIALAMAERHFRYTGPVRRAFRNTQKAYEDTGTSGIEGQKVDINKLFELKGLYIQYQANLISNLWKVLFLKPDHRQALYEIISLLEEKWYMDSEENRGFDIEYELEMLNLVPLEKALRLGSDFYGRDYDINYKLGAVLFRQAHMLKAHPELARIIAEENPPSPEDRFIDAKLFLRKCIAVRSTHVDAYRLLALLHEELEKEEDAYKYWKLITVVEQAEKKSETANDDPERTLIYDVARRKVEEFEKTPGSD